MNIFKWFDDVIWGFTKCPCPYLAAAHSKIETAETERSEVFVKHNRLSVVLSFFLFSSSSQFFFVYRWPMPSCLKQTVEGWFKVETGVSDVSETRRTPILSRYDSGKIPCLYCGSSPGLTVRYSLFMLIHVTLPNTIFDGEIAQLLRAFTKRLQTRSINVL